MGFPYFVSIPLLTKNISLFQPTTPKVVRIRKFMRSLSLSNAPSSRCQHKQDLLLISCLHTRSELKADEGEVSSGDVLTDSDFLPVSTHIIQCN